MPAGQPGCEPGLGGEGWPAGVTPPLRPIQAQGGQSTPSPPGLAAAPGAAGAVGAAGGSLGPGTGPSHPLPTGVCGLRGRVVRPPPHPLRQMGPWAGPTLRPTPVARHRELYTMKV